MWEELSEISEVSLWVRLRTNQLLLNCLGGETGAGIGGNRACPIREEPAVKIPSNSWLRLAHQGSVRDPTPFLERDEQDWQGIAKGYAATLGQTRRRPRSGAPPNRNARGNSLHEKS